MTKTRINWDEYFMSIAFIASLRSPDGETRHGCVIVSEDNRILSTGYNGYWRGILPGKQKKLPNKRPEKYPYFLHSERNALANAHYIPVGSKAYVTGQPCNDCLAALWQHGITKVIYDSKYKSRKDATNYNAEDKVRNDLINMTGMELIEFSSDYSFINEKTFQCSQDF